MTNCKSPYSVSSLTVTGPNNVPLRSNWDGDNDLTVRVEGTNAVSGTY